MNFQKIAPVDSSNTILNTAFKKAREKGIEKNLTGNWLQIIRKKESLKLDIINDSINSTLQKMGSSFPSFNALPAFYLQLTKLTLDYPSLLKSLAALDWAAQKIRSLHRDYVKRINYTKEQSMIKDVSKQFYGRVSSILKQIKVNLEYLEQARRVMRTYPDIKEMFTVCVYGFPNVGKTTLLNKLTGSKAVVAPYAFTTKSINSGYITVAGHKVQVLDVPGTLARDAKTNLIELQAELVVNELANVIIFVFDVSEYGGYSVEKQKKLLQKIKEKKKVLIYLSKIDLVEEIPELKYKVYSLEQLKEIIAQEAEHFATEKSIV
ncbi:MAG: GTPase [Nanoarchaeota archaeon]|nr:GTPase [Nanoarchaeota archaeon]